MKKFLMYLFFGVGLLYTRAIARLFISKTEEQPDEFASDEWDDSHDAH